MLTGLLAALVLSAGEADAAAAPTGPTPTPVEITEHRGSLGVLAAVGPLLRSTTVKEQGFRAALDVALTAGVIGESTELVLAGRLTGGASWGGALMGGLRPNFGRERWKTFADVMIAVHVAPMITVGPRAGVGVQYDFASIAGVQISVAGQLGFGATLLLQGELLIGLQLRSYVFER